jgi:hypothetical protein
MITTISTLPEPPSRNSPATFSDKADSFLGAMPTLVSELNSFVNEVNTLSFKTACKIATTAPITLNGTQTIDGQNAASGDRVLVKNQNSASQNGIYVVSPNAWTRAADMDSVVEVAGSFVPVTYGNINGGKIFYTTFNATGAVLGTTDIPWNSLTEGSITGIGTLAVANGGTGLASYTAGDFIYATGTASLARLAAVSSGNVLKSGTTPSWGKVALASDVSGTLPVANGGTGLSSILSQTGLYLQSNGIGGIAAATLPGSNTVFPGIVQLATSEELAIGTNSTKAITPSVLRSEALMQHPAWFDISSAGGLTSLEFTSIPSWVKRISILIRRMSLDQNTNYTLQLGNSSAYVTSNYSYTTSDYNGVYATDTTRFVLNRTVSAAYFTSGILTLMRVVVGGVGYWFLSGNTADEAAVVSSVAGSVQLTGLTRLRLGSLSGTAVFDSAIVALVYE